MLGRVTASEVIREAQSGRTRPVLMLCEADAGGAVEVFCKLSAGCFDGVTSLAREVVAACLAIDLNLPVPTPYAVEIPSALASVVTDPEISERLGTSSPIGFGSAKVANQFSAWTAGHRVTEFMLPSVVGAFVFDAVIDNADRRPSNPNCLVSGERLHLIDHELAFPSTAGLPGWRPPWQANALSWLDRADGHLFYPELKMRNLDFGPLRQLWSGISDDRLLEYGQTIPPEWETAQPAVEEALDRVRNARDNLDGVIAEIRRVLQ